MKDCSGCTTTGTECESTVAEALISIRPEYVRMIKRWEKSVDIRSGTVSSRPAHACGYIALFQRDDWRP